MTGLDIFEDLRSSVLFWEIWKFTSFLFDYEIIFNNYKIKFKFYTQIQ